MARGWGIIYRETALCQPDLFSIQPLTALAEAALCCTRFSPRRSAGTARKGGTVGKVAHSWGPG